jgi:RNA polymerase sigma-70 factor (ECF subfamily)
MNNNFMKPLSDAELIKLFKDGNNDAYEEIISRYQAHIYTYVLSMVKSHDATSDILQDVGIRIFRKLKDYKEENKLKNWIFIITKNITMDFFRKNNKKFVPLEAQSEDDVSYLDILPDKDPLPLEVLITNSRKELLRDAIDHLSKEEKELIYLKDYLTFKDISQIQNKPIGTLLSKFNRSLKKIKKFMNKREMEEYNENL